MAFGIFWTPAMSHLTDLAERRGLDYAYGFALVNLAWAPGQALGASGGGALARATSDAVPYLILSALCLLSLALLAAHGDPQAPRSQPRRDRRARLPHLRASSASRPWPSPRPDDRGALHARSADEIVEIAGYLASEEHVRAAKQTGADAIHPGYGFLSENPDFAEAVEAAGLVFVGPSPDALRAGGDKLEAKRIAREAGVPVVPEGEPGRDRLPARDQGGRRRRRARDARRAVAGRSSTTSLAAAKREAEAAFGDDRVFCERYVERPRHVEIQLLADAHGDVVALGERECSIQRRHQKVLEEAPSPALDAALRAEMSEAAVAFARAIGYRSAGTAEFMLSGRDFYFLELNGRIQVEHPVTEAVTGIDIVREQLRIAQGEPLGITLRAPCSQVTRSRCGSTPRIRAPSSPRPAGSSGCACPETIRVDAGVEEGDEVGVALRPDDREADRARRDPRRGARAPARGAGGDRGRRA